jgi:uncharacterized protein YxeA
MAFDYRVTIVFDYTAEPETGDEGDVDEDELHDAIMDSFDTVDLEGSYEATAYDAEGDETDDKFTVNFNCDNVREVRVEKLND